MYSLELRPSVEKDLQSLPKQTQQKILSKIQQLAVDPLPYYTVRLQGPKPAFRIRIADYHVIYMIDHVRGIVQIQRVGHRRDIYR